MSKYIIELNDDCNMVLQICITEHGSTYIESAYAENLEELNSDYINEHFGDLQDTAYQRGLEDAWEAARKLFSSMADSDIKKAFPTEWNNGGFNALFNLQPQEAIEKLKAYEEKQKADDEIKVGDVVERYISGKFDSTGIYLGEAGDYWNCLFWTGAVFTTFAYPKNQFKKTGIHLGIDKIMEEMRT